MKIEGRLEGGAAKVGAYDYTEGDHVVAVDEERVSVTWLGCPDDSDETERALQEWFERLLDAQVLTTAVPSSVHWTGRTVFENGKSRLRVTSTHPFGFIRDQPTQLSAYAAMADAIRIHPEVREAARHFRATARLIREGEDIAPGEAYLTVATLVVAVEGDERQADWRAFGNRLHAAGEPFDSDDLEQVYASAQWGRHHLQSIASKTLTRLGRKRLTWYETCWRAAEVLEAYVLAKNRGAI